MIILGRVVIPPIAELMMVVIAEWVPVVFQNAIAIKSVSLIIIGVGVPR